METPLSLGIDGLFPLAGIIIVIALESLVAMKRMDSVDQKKPTLNMGGDCTLLYTEMV